jgi:TM2 domain-containing membrane protein YozV
MDPNANPNTTPNANASSANPLNNPAFQNTIPTGIKSSVAAGLLGIFLGAFGAHNWYLGEKKKGLIHVALTGGGFILIMLSAVMVALTAKVPFMGFFFGFLMFLSYIAIMGSGIWGFVEGIIILVQGDAALAAKGYTVAAPVAYAQPAQPAQPAAPATPAANTEVKEVSEDKAAKSDKKDDKKEA